jgi:hypothetical protein
MNKLYTLGYFRKRLMDAGIKSDVIVKKYPERDSRYWTLSLCGDRYLFCTCHKTDDECYFEFWDGGQIIQARRIVKTQSMNVVIAKVFNWIDDL